MDSIVIQFQVTVLENDLTPRTYLKIDLVFSPLTACTLPMKPHDVFLVHEISIKLSVLVKVRRRLRNFCFCTGLIWRVFIDHWYLANEVLIFWVFLRQLVAWKLYLLRLRGAYLENIFLINFKIFGRNPLRGQLFFPFAIWLWNIIFTRILELNFRISPLNFQLFLVIILQISS